MLLSRQTRWLNQPSVGVEQLDVDTLNDQAALFSLSKDIRVVKWLSLNQVQSRYGALQPLLKVILLFKYRV